MTTETRHYFKVPFEITEDNKFKNMRNTTQLLYFILCRLANNFADKNGWFYRSLTTLVSDSGLERKTVIQAKKELEKNNFIDVDISQYDNFKGRACNSYKLNGFRFRTGE